MIGIYICKRCNLVLFRIEEVVTSHNIQKLTLNSYETLFENVHPTFYVHRCPACYGIGKPSIAIPDADQTLRIIEIQEETYEELLKIWESLTESELDTTHGLSLYRKDVKDLIFLELLSEGGN